jgi:RNA polymerase II subunit A small phosphatase-like protein
MGCLSAAEFEDAAPSKSKPPKNSAAIAPKTAPTDANGPAAAEANVKDTSVPNDSSVADGILVRTSEPTTAPLDEVCSLPTIILVPSFILLSFADTIKQTAGLTSGAVQAPGSGSEIIHQHMHHRNDSEHHLAHASANRTTDSGDLSDSEDGAHQEMLYEDEYEDEEDRLIAQGGIGIPLDEVGVKDVADADPLAW